MTRGWIGALVAVPIALSTLLLVVVLAGERVAPERFGVSPHNIAEAAALGDAAATIRRLRLGENPERFYPVRARVLSSTAQDDAVALNAMPLEAAMWARRPELIRLLDQEGLIVGPEMRRHLACLAADLDLPEAAQYLSRPGDPQCVRGEAYREVVGRASAPPQ